MKESTRLLLEEEIKTGKYVYKALKDPTDYFEFIESHKDFSHLFDIYLAEEFDDVDSFFTTFTHKYTHQLEFYNFILQHSKDFKITRQVIEDNAIGSAENLLRRDVGRAVSKVAGKLYLNGLVGCKQSFVDIVLDIAGKGKLLEIGSGVDLPITSLLFARELGEVTSIDRFGDLWTSLDFFKKMGVNVTNGKFDENTNIDDFQTIASQKACDGAVAVVDRLANNGGEQVYVQELCDCASPSDEDLMTNLIEYLKRKDSGMKSFSIKRTQTGLKELHVNGLDNDDGLIATYVTNSPKHVDDIAQIICERY